MTWHVVVVVVVVVAAVVVVVAAVATVTQEMRGGGDTKGLRGKKLHQSTSSYKIKSANFCLFLVLFSV